MAVAEVVALLDPSALQRAVSHSTYQRLKEDELLEDRRKVKDDVKSHALKGWIRNGGEYFTLSA